MGEEFKQGSEPFWDTRLQPHSTLLNFFQKKDIAINWIKGKVTSPNASSNSRSNLRSCTRSQSVQKPAAKVLELAAGASAPFCNLLFEDWYLES